MPKPCGTRYRRTRPGRCVVHGFGWWHHVESLTPFNVLVNYWWNAAPNFGAPHGALLHALLTIRDLPADQRSVWAFIFQQLVFQDPEQALAHSAAGATRHAGAALGGTHPQYP